MFKHILFCAIVALSLVHLGANADERRDLIDKMIENLKSPDWQDRLSAAVGLGNAGADARHALPALAAAKSDKHEKVRRWADKSVKKIYGALKTDVPLEKLVAEIVAKPNPPKWNRIPAYLHQGEKLAEGIKTDVIDLVGPGKTGAFVGGWLEIRIPLPYAKHSHARAVGQRVFLHDKVGLKVSLTQEYIPQLWEEREIVASNELRGKFGRLELPKLPQGLKWLVIYDDLKNGFDLDRDGRADITLRVAPSDYQSEH